MKILCLNESLIMGGQEKVFIEYLKLLEKTDYDIEILIEEDNGNRNIFYSDIPSKYKVNFLCDSNLMDSLERSRIRRKNNLIEKIKYNYLLKKQSKIAKEKLYDYLKSKSFDLVLDFSNILESDMMKGRNIRWIHSSIDGIKSKKVTKLKDKVKNSKHSIVICNEMRKEIIKKIKCEDKLVTIYNPFNLESITILSREDARLENDKLEIQLLQENYILSVSRLDKNKDIVGLIQSYKIAKDMGLKEKLYIIGEGNDRKNIEKEIKRNNLVDNVILLGLKKNPYIWMKNSIFFVLNSKKEGLPTVLIEALILKKTMISTDCATGPKEILENGKNGILVEKGNYKTLGLKILYLANHPKEKAILEESGYRSVTRFSWRKNFRKIKIFNRRIVVL